jgi:glycosyltransferase involved in cell wall biosynthesis
MTEALQVVIDMTFPNRNRAGTGVYARELIDELKKRDDISVTTVAAPQAGMPSTLRWLLTEAGVAAAGARLLHFPAGVAPWRVKAPFVLTVHDTISNEFQEDHPLEWRVYLRWFVPGRARSAARVIVGSECLRQELIDDWRVPAERVRVTPYGIAPRFFVETGARKPNDPPVLLLSGAPIRRKNLGLVLEAMAGAPEGSALRRASLSISGAEASLFPNHVDRIKLMGLEDRVNWLGRVEDDKMPATVAAADLLVYPSFHEGFGFPALEAMAAGTPVVASDAPCLPEVLGDGALFVPPTDVKAFIDAAESLLTSQQLRDELIPKGRARAAKFTWQRCADLTVGVYQEAAREH